jgi:hypothetical protein
MYEMIRNQYTCHYESFGDTWRKRKCKLLGHILFCHRDDPLFQVTFSYNIFFARTSPLLRPGRPRADWLIESLKDACLNLFGPDRHFNFSDRQLLSDIQQAAINRTRPFRKDHKNDGTSASQGLWPLEEMPLVVLVAKLCVLSIHTNIT